MRTARAKAFGPFLQKYNQRVIIIRHADLYSVEIMLSRVFSDVGVDVDKALSTLGRTLHYLLGHAKYRVDLFERGISEQRQRRNAEQRVKRIHHIPRAVREPASLVVLAREDELLQLVGVDPFGPSEYPHRRQHPPRVAYVWQLKHDRILGGQQAMLFSGGLSGSGTLLISVSGQGCAGETGWDVPFRDAR